MFVSIYITNSLLLGNNIRSLKQIRRDPRTIEVINILLPYALLWFHKYCLGYIIHIDKTGKEQNVIYRLNTEIDDNKAPCICDIVIYFFSNISNLVLPKK